MLMRTVGKEAAVKTAGSTGGNTVTVATFESAPLGLTALVTFTQ